MQTLVKNMGKNQPYHRFHHSLYLVVRLEKDKAFLLCSRGNIKKIPHFQKLKQHPRRKTRWKSQLLQNGLFVVSTSLLTNMWIWN